ncbi:hypothetical protein GCM10009798_13920 [Nocardioides panacihumi]|uniref:Uncharacterized protein n=1 Tax=Nocardioides panacihumi TaxID=400774 RepID=A0ABN2QNZ7_9ACTN
MNGAPELQINAWLPGTLRAARGAPSPHLDDWTIRERGTLPPHEVLYAKEEPDLKDWRQAGWGVVLPDDDDLDDRQRAEATDAPAAVRDLLDHRDGAPVLRYRPELGSAYFMLCERGQEARKVKTAGGELGPDARQLPHYLLIVASPEQIPWRIQYVLNATHFVGRLDLDDVGLRHYVSALIDGWPGSTASRRTAITWSVDWGEADITWLMRHGLAEKLAAKYREDVDVTNAIHLAQDDATLDKLLAALGRQPGVIVTTSHGATPVDSPPEQVRAALGRPVDQSGDVLGAEMIDRWEPQGAIWYAHACCSAGADATTVYDRVAAPGSEVDRVLQGVAAKAGARTAPLPRQLLGCVSPLRAFVGHVEPTFNWTLRDPVNGQLLTSSLVKTLYNGLYQPQSEPIGYALSRHYEPVGGLWSDWATDRDRINGGDDAELPKALTERLTALDRQSLVILGDPTVAVP